MTTVVLTCARPEYDLKVGDIGIVVERRGIEEVEVEFGLTPGGARCRVIVLAADIRAAETCGGCWKVLEEHDYEYGPSHRWRKCSVCGRSDPMSGEGLLSF